MHYLIEQLLDPQVLTMLFAAIAAGATVLTLAMPLLASDTLNKRMKAVALEREKIRQRERERLAQGSRVSLRQSPKAYCRLLISAVAAPPAATTSGSFTRMLFLLKITTGPIHPPTANDDEPLGIGRFILGWLTLAFIVVGFTPVPLRFLP